VGTSLRNFAGTNLDPTSAESAANSGTDFEFEADAVVTLGPSSNATSLGARGSEIRQTAEKAATNPSAGFQILVAPGRLVSRIRATRCEVCCIRLTTACASAKPMALPMNEQNMLSERIEALETRRSDIGAAFQTLSANGVMWSARGSWTSQRQNHQYGEITERDDHDTGFAELTVRRDRPAHPGGRRGDRTRSFSAD